MLRYFKQPITVIVRKDDGENHEHYFEDAGDLLKFEGWKEYCRYDKVKLLKIGNDVVFSDMMAKKPMYVDDLVDYFNDRDTRGDVELL